MVGDWIVQPADVLEKTEKFGLGNMWPRVVLVDYVHDIEFGLILVDEILGCY
jgi:hypothetical protein